MDPFRRWPPFPLTERLDEEHRDAGLFLAASRSVVKTKSDCASGEKPAISGLSSSWRVCLLRLRQSSSICAIGPLPGGAPAAEQLGVRARPILRPAASAPMVGSLQIEAGRWRRKWAKLPPRLLLVVLVVVVEDEAK